MARKRKEPPSDSARREALEEWFPTVVRYVGVGLLIYAGVIDKGANPALIPSAMGMILFKTVYGSGPPDKER
jgi:hypothetical protein